MHPPFRSSQFIDFNAGTVLVDPMELVEKNPGQKTLEVKIDFFESRVEVWRLGVAVEMLKQIEANKPPSIWSHAAYAMIGVISSYFEMIGKTLNPDSKISRTAGIDFNWGFCDVYPVFKPAAGETYEDSDLTVVADFRNLLRNGLYHLGFTKYGLLIHDSKEIAEDFTVRKVKSDLGQEVLAFLVNPHKATRTIVNHFPSFLARLRDPKNTVLREKFVEFYDDFHTAQLHSVLNP